MSLVSLVKKIHLVSGCESLVGRRGESVHAGQVVNVNGVVWGAARCVLTGLVRSMGRDGNSFKFMFI